MGNEQDQSLEQPLRSPAEVQKRIKELEARIALNDVQINIGTYANPIMVQTREYETLVAKRNELRWFLGENVGITDGVE